MKASVAPFPILSILPDLCNGPAPACLLRSVVAVDDAPVAGERGARLPVLLLALGSEMRAPCRDVASIFEQCSSSGRSLERPKRGRRCSFPLARRQHLRFRFRCSLARRPHDRLTTGSGEECGNSERGFLDAGEPLTAGSGRGDPAGTRRAPPCRSQPAAGRPSVRSSRHLSPSLRPATTTLLLPRHTHTRQSSYTPTPSSSPSTMSAPQETPIQTEIMTLTRCGPLLPPFPARCPRPSPSCPFLLPPSLRRSLLAASSACSARIVVFSWSFETQVLTPSAFPSPSHLRLACRFLAVCVTSSLGRPPLPANSSEKNHPSRHLPGMC